MTVQRCPHEWAMLFLVVGTFGTLFLAGVALLLHAIRSFWD